MLYVKDYIWTQMWKLYFPKSLQNIVGKYSEVSLRAAIILKLGADKSLQWKANLNR